jgi:hypothetical protein
VPDQKTRRRPKADASRAPVPEMASPETPLTAIFTSPQVTVHINVDLGPGGKAPTVAFVADYVRRLRSELEDEEANPADQADAALQNHYPPAGHAAAVAAAPDAKDDGPDPSGASG